MTSLEERLAILERSYIALDAKYRELLEKSTTSAGTATATDKSPNTDVTATNGTTQSSTDATKDKPQDNKVIPVQSVLRYKIQTRDNDNNIVNKDQKAVSFTVDKFKDADNDELIIHDSTLCDTATLVSPYPSILQNWKQLSEAAEQYKEADSKGEAGSKVDDSSESEKTSKNTEEKNDEVNNDEVKSDKPNINAPKSEETKSDDTKSDQASKSEKPKTEGATETEKASEAPLGPKSEEETNAQAHADLRDLLKVIHEQGGTRIQSWFKTHFKYVEDGKVTFDFLWMIFPVGEVIFSRPFLGEPQMFVVAGYDELWTASFKGKYQPWSLTVWMYDWDGERFKRRYLTLKIDNFNGPKQITALPFYPMRYHNSADEVRAELLKRGKVFKRLCMAGRGEQMFTYKGPASMSQRIVTVEENSIEVDNASVYGRQSLVRKTALRSSQVDSHIMVDFLSYKRYGPGIFELGSISPDDTEYDCTCNDCLQNEELSKATRRYYDDHFADDWEDEQYMLCPPRVVGYVLREKRWAQLQVKLIEEVIHGDRGAYDKVRLAADYNKEFLLQLVENHGTGDPNDGKSIKDIVANKGNSLVILLYGPPGVGKTSTAETIAIAAKRPLFSVSVTDVGTKAQHVEGNLDKIFDLAATWEAILLIDEADVFLESRSKGHGFNTERNALVSVFLRVLEYYEGILFLTTNQIAQFDVAVQSRIHIALKYDQLNDEQTTSIFDQFLVQVQKNNQIKERDLQDIRNWVRNEVIRRKYGFDGRQIRNVLSCAMTLARARGKKLSKEEVVDVVDFVRDFKTEFQLQFDRYISSQAGRDRGQS